MRETTERDRKAQRAREDLKKLRETPVEDLKPRLRKRLLSSSLLVMMNLPYDEFKVVYQDLIHFAVLAGLEVDDIEANSDKLNQVKSDPVQILKVLDELLTRDDKETDDENGPSEG